MEFWVVIGVLGAVAFAFMMIYNRLVALRQTREQAFSDIDVQLKQRLDLVPQLVETVKGYAAHEKQLMEDLTAARAQVQKASGTGERISAENQLTRALGGFYAVAENYPDLKASSNFQHLASELSDIENKIAAARRFFNNATSELNTAIQQFPAVLIARQLGFNEGEFFEVTDVDRAALEKAPQVKFGS